MDDWHRDILYMMVAGTKTKADIRFNMLRTEFPVTLGNVVNVLLRLREEGHRLSELT